MGIDEEEMIDQTTEALVEMIDQTTEALVAISSRSREALQYMPKLLEQLKSPVSHDVVF